MNTHNERGSLVDNSHVPEDYKEHLVKDLHEGVDLEEDEEPEEAHKEDHPTPNRPSGRMGP